MSVANPLRWSQLYCSESRCALAVTSSGLVAESGSSDSAVRSMAVVRREGADAVLCLREVEVRMVEHASSIVVLIIILRAQKVSVVLAIERFVKESRGCPLGPGGALGESERMTTGVGQWEEEGVRMVNSSYQMSRSVSIPRQRWRK